MRRLLISSIFTFFILVIYIYVTVFKSIETLTYFPKDDLDTFLSSHTRLQLSKNQTLKWTSSSDTKVQPYLRQDISILYENGKFKRAVNLRKEGKKRLNQQKKIPLVGNKLYETISFHHSEIHRNDDNITSNQQMSADYLYVYVNKQHHHSFKQTKT